MTEIKAISCGNVNCYLLSGDRGAVLVDTGRAGYGEKVLSACLGAGVRLILLTHGHPDHIQNTAFLSDRLGAPAALHPGDLDLLKDNLSQPLSAGTAFGKFLLALSRHSFRTQMSPAFLPQIALEDGQDLNPWGVDARVVALPGHTVGSVGVDVEGRALLVGDAMMNLAGLSPALLYTSREQLLNSVDKIHALGPRTLYFGHGRPRGCS